MKGRRAFLRNAGLAAGAAVVLGPVRVGRGHDVTLDEAPRAVRTPERRDRPPPADAAVRAYLGPLGVGARLVGSTVIAVHGIFHGALPLLLRDAQGRRFQLDVMRRDESRPGVARTAQVDVYVANRGTGTVRTEEAHGLAALALARYLRARERAGVRPPPGLVRLSGREAHGPHGVFLVAEEPASSA